MKIAFKITLFAMSLALAMSAAPLSRSARTQVNLMQAMMQSAAASRGNPTAMECFDYYTPIMTGITNQYEENYAACLYIAEASREELDKLTVADKEALILASQQSCASVTKCSEMEHSLDVFECYWKNGDASSRTMFTISANASEIYNIVYEDYRRVEVEENRCTSAADRQFVEEQARTYDELTACLRGDSPIPTQAVPTSTPAAAATDSTTTEIWTTVLEEEFRVKREAPKDDAAENKRNFRLARIMSELSESI